MVQGYNTPFVASFVGYKLSWAESIATLVEISYYNKSRTGVRTPMAAFEIKRRRLSYF